MKHELMKLPYSLDALDPYMSAETLQYHYGKHHQAYINKLNELIVGTEFEDMSLEEIIKTSSGGIFNNAAQIWNHNLFWNTLISSHNTSLNSLLPGEKKLQNFANMIEKSFGSFDEMKTKFKTESLSRFGSGWVWLVQKGNMLEIYSSPNAENPLTLGGEALLGLDVWEHSYYIDYRNDRAKFVDNFWSIVDWEVVAGRMK